MSRRSDVSRLLTALMRDHGCTVVRTKGNHWKVTRAGGPSIIVSPTSGDPHALANIKRDCRRYLGIAL